MRDASLENNIITLHGRGWSVRRLSLEFGVSRGRIDRILARNENERRGGSQKPKRITRPAKLDMFKQQINELLETNDKTRITNQRIFEIIRDNGYQGGMTILQDYLIKVRGKKVHEPVVCVETRPGQRGAHDWSEYYIELTGSGKKEKVTFFSFILGYSRRQYIELVEDKSQKTLLRCLINTFIYFDGVVCEIKSDNQKACVDRWEGDRPVFNSNYLEFATHYRFRPLAIHPGRPRENLKIERPFYYFETNFLNGRRFYDRADIKAQLTGWLLERNDQRIHRRTRQKPIDLYAEELAYLQPLPSHQFDTSRIEYRIVNNESCIEWSGYYYCVPPQYMYESCPVRESGSEVIIYTPDCQEIKRYPVAEKGRKDRYIGRSRESKPERSRISAPEIIKRVSCFSPVMNEYIEGVKRHKPGSYVHHLRHILSLKVNYQVEDIVTAVRRALRHKVYESSAIENFLSLNAEKKNELQLKISYQSGSKDGSGK